MKRLLLESPNGVSSAVIPIRKIAYETITPWSLVEPPTPIPASVAVREQLFGNAQTLGLLYSGNLGRAHTFHTFLELAKELNSCDVAFCFAGRGPKTKDIRSNAEGLKNFYFAGFATEQELDQRLAAADIHLVSLDPKWSGCVVPSKFFGALAVGRPVLYEGASDSDIAMWIRQFNVGWVVSDQDDVKRVASDIRRLSNDRESLARLQSHCHEIYQKHFSKSVQLNRLESIITKCNN